MTELNQQAQLMSINKQELSNESLGALPSLSSRAMFWRPKYLCESSWLDHLPFAFWLIESIKPKILVELGVGTGASYFAFCQAMDKLNVDGRCYGIDQWQTTEHAQQQFTQVQRYNKEQYEEFSRLVSDSWRQAADHFLNSSVNLLHLNTADAELPLLEIFQQWLPKLSSDAVVLLHHSQNTQLLQVQALKKQLQSEHRHFEFMQQHGLLVVAIKEMPSLSFERLMDIHPGDKTYEVVQSVFSRLGKACAETMNAEEARKLVAQVSEELLGTQQQLSDRQLRIDSLLKDLNEHKIWLSQRQQEVGQLSHQLSLTEQQKQQQQHILNERIALLEKTRKELQLETENLFKHVEQLTEQKQQVTAKLLTSESGLQAALQQLAPVMQTSQQQKNELVQLQQDKAQMERQLQVQASDIEKLHQQLAVITRTAEEQRLQSAKLQAAPKVVQQTPDQLAKISGLEAQISQLRTELTNSKQAASNTAAQLEQQQQQLTATLEQSQQQLQAEASQKTDWQQKYAELSTQLQKKQDELGQCYNELAELAKVVQQQQQQQANQKAMLKAQLLLEKKRITLLKKTLSWKLSWPLRAIAAVFSNKDELNKSLRMNLKLVEESGLFDQNWYLSQYPDVAKAQVTPLEHYVRFGGFEGRYPNPDFDSGFYLAQYQDVVEAGLNPLVHFIKFGRAEQRLFSARAE